MTQFFFTIEDGDRYDCNPVKRRLFKFVGVCSNLKLLLLLVVIALMPALLIGPGYLEATEVVAEETAVPARGSILLNTLAANDQAVKAGDLTGLEPSRLLLLILGVMMVGIAYQRSWKGMRKSQ